MELINTIQQIISNAVSGMSLTDMTIGTVTNAKPLEITLQTSMQVLKKSVLYLTQPVQKLELDIAGSDKKIMVFDDLKKGGKSFIASCYGWAKVYHIIKTNGDRSMNTLPENSALENGVIFEEQSSLTYYADPLTNQIDGLADGLQAITQTIDIILSVERFEWGIYSANFGTELENIAGYDPGYTAAQLKNKISDALSVDSRIIGIKEFSYTNDKEKMTAFIVISTIYGDTEKEVVINK